MDTAISLENPAPLGETNFKVCIICQKEKKTTVQNVTSVTALQTAIEKRQDTVAKRLQPVLTPDILEHQKMVWHGECRRRYTLKKSCELAEKRRVVVLNTHIQDSETNSSLLSGHMTRSHRDTFDYMTQCIICEKPFTKRKKASIAMTESRGQSLKRKAEELNDQHMLDKIQAYPGATVDLVAIDVRYHIPCINAYINKRPIAKATSTDSCGKDDVFFFL